jgi:class 3 adenylate cyclase
VGLSEDEVVRRSGASPERVRELAAMGILAPEPGAGEPFRRGDAMRVQLVEELESAGIPAEQVGRAIADGALTLSYLDALPDPPSRSDRTFRDLCAEMQLPFRLLERIYAAFGFPAPRIDDFVRRDELDIVSGLSILFDAGLDEAEVLRAARVWGEPQRRVAHHQVHSFHELIEEPFRRQGLSEDQALAATLTQVGVRVIPFVHRLVAWLYARHFERAATEHRLGHVERALDAAGLHRRPPPRPAACVFADLSGSTQLTEELGDEAAADMSLRLAVTMQEVADAHDGLVVKMLGDGVHFHFQDPRNAVIGSLDFVERAGRHDLPPTHIGVEAGPMTYTDGDYYGLTVILAARIAAAAGPAEVLVGPEARRLTEADDVRFEEVGPISLKGIAKPVRVHRAIRATPLT